MYVGKVALSPLKSQTTFGYGGLLVGGTNSTFCKKKLLQKENSCTVTTRWYDVFLSIH